MGDKGTAIGYNLFAYCQNNPTMYSDPSGHSIILACICIGAVLGGGFGAYASYKKTGEVKGWAVVAGAAVGGLAGWGLGVAITSLGAATTGTITGTIAQATPELYQTWQKAEQGLRNLIGSVSDYASRVFSTPFGDRVVDAILTHCRSYFSECYADAMSIALLKLTPCEYLGGFREELRSLLHVPSRWMTPAESRNWVNRQSVHLAQRFAIVLAACCKHPRLGNFTVADCRQAIEKYSSPSDSAVQDESFRKFSSTLMQNFVALIDPYTALPPGSCLHPPVSLQYVIEYLSSCIELLYRDPPEMQVGSDATRYYSLDRLVLDFDTIIRKGNMFGEKFYNMIYEHHDRISKKNEALFDQTQ